MTTHFNQPQKRQAEFFMPPNLLKEKAGSGGLSEDILLKAQKLLEEGKDRKTEKEDRGRSKK